MPEAILEARGLKKHFTVGHKDILRRQPVTVKAVDGVDFALKSGETFGLVGESGSGKSTIAYMVAGMYGSTGGDLFFKGRSLSEGGGRRSLEYKKDIQIVFQDPGSSLNPRRTIAQNLAVPLQLHRPDCDVTRETIRLLEMVDLPASYLFRYPNSLSGGEKQIVAVARALATEPSLIILDEPTSALDVSVQGKIITLLMRLQKELNLTYLFITHDLSLMRNIADRVAIMYLGKMSEIAPGAEFFAHPQHPYTQMLLSAIPVVSEEEEALKPEKVESAGEIPSPVDLPVGCGFNTRCPAASDDCFRNDPVMKTIRPDHMARCHLFEERS